MTPSASAALAELGEGFADLALWRSLGYSISALVKP